MVVGDPWDPATNIGPMIRADHRAGVEGFIDDSVRSDGTKLLEGTTPLPEKGYIVNPVLLGGMSRHSRAVQQEIFGPV
jgi:acyl-CoA reductase-like NAD-dependent aldehyde dehydrogenase